MADYDVIADPLPQLGNLRPAIHQDRPSISSLKAALQDLDATTFTDARLASMTFNDLIYALRITSADETAPSAPTGLEESEVTATTLTLTWSANDPAEGVVGYRVYRDTVEVEDTAFLTFDDSELTPEASYSYTVTAYDANDNESAPSEALVVEMEAA